MATTILGIDLGSYAVKVARLEAGFRSLQLVGIYEQRVPGADALTAEEAALELPPETPVLLEAAGDDKAEADEADDEAERGPGSGPVSLDPAPARPARTDELLARQLHALEQILSDIKLRGEQVAIALGPEVTLRLIDLPLSDPKKVAQALPFELAGQLMTEPDEQVVDQTLAQLEPRIGGSEGEVGSCWVAACVPRAVLRDRLAALTRVGLDPRLCGATALSPAALLAGRPTLPRPRPGAKTAEVLPAAVPVDEAPEWPIWIVDLGHRSTHVCAVAGHPSRAGQVVVPFARTIARGGMHLTDALAKHFVLEEAQAEQMKHDHGVEEESDPAIASTLRQALRPLLRDLRQTLSAYIARYGQGPSKILATGGGAQLRGLLGLFEAELGIPFELLQPPAWAS